MPASALPWQRLAVIAARAGRSVILGSSASAMPDMPLSQHSLPSIGSPTAERSTMPVSALPWQRLAVIAARADSSVFLWSSSSAMPCVPLSQHSLSSIGSPTQERSTMPASALPWQRLFRIAARAGRKSFSSVSPKRTIPRRQKRASQFSTRPSLTAIRLMPSRPNSSTKQSDTNASAPPRRHRPRSHLFSRFPRSVTRSIRTPSAWSRNISPHSVGCGSSSTGSGSIGSSSGRTRKGVAVDRLSTVKSASTTSASFRVSIAGPSSSWKNTVVSRPAPRRVTPAGTRNTPSIATRPGPTSTVSPGCASASATAIASAPSRTSTRRTALRWIRLSIRVTPAVQSD